MQTKENIQNRQSLQSVQTTNGQRQRRDIIQLGLHLIPDKLYLFTNSANNVLIFFYINDIVLIYHCSVYEEAARIKHQLIDCYKFC